MRVERVHNNIRYTFSNENIRNGDKVFRIGNGRVVNDKEYIFHDLSFKFSGFPSEPHIIIDIKHSDYKPYQVRTNNGYSPIEAYFKVIKKEKQIVKDETAMFKSYIWIEID